MQLKKSLINILPQDWISFRYRSAPHWDGSREAGLLGVVVERWGRKWLDERLVRSVSEPLCVLLVQRYGSWMPPISMGSQQRCSGTGDGRQGAGPWRETWEWGEETKKWEGTNGSPGSQRPWVKVLPEGQKEQGLDLGRILEWNDHFTFTLKGRGELTLTAYFLCDSFFIHSISFNLTFHQNLKLNFRSADCMPGTLLACYRLGSFMVLRATARWILD